MIKLNTFKFTLLLMSITILPLFGQDNAFQAPDNGFTSWLPAKDWEEALLSGNGTMGAMVFGQPFDETFILNHASLYMPTTPPMPPIDQAGRLDEIREAILNEDYKTAARIPYEQSLKEGYEDTRWSDPYIPAFDVRLQLQAANVQQYIRKVDYETGEAIVSWRDDTGEFSRKTFVSRADSVIVIYMEGDAPINGSIAFKQRSISWENQQIFRDNVESVEIDAKDNQLSYRSAFKQKWEGSLEGYEGMGKLMVEEGEITADGNKIVVKNAKSIMLLVDISPNYNYSESHLSKMSDKLEALADDYSTLLAAHTAIHTPLIRSVKLDLKDSKEAQDVTDWHSETMVGRAQQEAEISPKLIERQFNAARYHIISATGSNPPNLQGIWGGTWTPPWSSDFTHDGNIQVAISSFLYDNPALLMAYFDYHDKMLPYYQDNAKSLFGTRGIHLPSHTSTHGWDNHFGPEWCLSLWTGGAGWAAAYYYDYWLFTVDKAFLEQRAYPFMKAAALFYEDFLQAESEEVFVFNPSYSPENTPANSNAQASINATMDIMIARQLLRNCIAAARELCIDEDKIQLWEGMMEKMPAYQINEAGELKEWTSPLLEENHTHRHVSHLYALYDRVDQDFQDNPALHLAAKKVIDRRMEHRRKENGGEMVFGLAQMAIVASHLEDKTTTAKIIDWLARYYWTSSMATLHNPGALFNMDLSGGYPTVVMKALAYTEPGLLKIFPAKPDHWREGSLEGMQLIGQTTLQRLSWEGNTVELQLLSEKDQELSIQFPDNIQSVESDGSLSQSTDNAKAVQIQLKAGIPHALTLSF